VTGNRLPYAPRNLLTTALGWTAPAGPELRIEAVHIASQFGDPVNSLITVSDGQQGPVPAVTLWNVAANWFVPALNVTLFGSVKNVLDEAYIVDRTRGLLPGTPRWAQVGASHSF